MIERRGLALYASRFVSKTKFQRALPFGIAQVTPMRNPCHLPPETLSYDMLSTTLAGDT
jgi:hypothetical protein